MAEVIVGEVFVDVTVEPVRGTQPIDVHITLVDNDRVIGTKTYVLSKSDIGTLKKFEKVFKITEAGKHTIYTRTILKNPWGTDAPRDSNVLSFELITPVIPMPLDEPWVLYYDDRMYAEDAIVAQNDFVARGWNIVDRMSVSEVYEETKADWNRFVNDTRHAICIFSYNQCPFFWQGPTLWATLLDGTGMPGTIGSSYADDRYIYGNKKKHHAEDFALVKYLRYQDRSVVMIFDDDDHLNASLNWHKDVWLYVAELRSAVYFEWLILNKIADVVDHEVVD